MQREGNSFLLSAVAEDCTAVSQVQALQAEAEQQAAEVARLHATTPSELYLLDLDAFEAALDERDAQDAHEAELLVAQQKRAGRGGAGKVRGTAHALL